MKQVVPHLGPERGRRLAGLQLQDRRLDVRRQLAPLQRAEAAAVLGGSILGVLLGQQQEILSLQQQGVHMLRLSTRRLPAIFTGAGLGQEQDVPRLEREPGLELLAVVLQVTIDLLLGDRDAQRDLASDHPLHHQLLPQPLLHPIQRQSLRLEQVLELTRAGDVHALHHLVQLLVHLRIFDHDLLALGLLQLDPTLDDALEQAEPQLLPGLGVGRLLLGLVEIVRLGLVELVQRDRVVVHDTDHAVEDRVGLGQRLTRNRERRRRPRGRRRAGIDRRGLALAGERHPGRHGTAGGEQGQDGQPSQPTRRAHASESSTARIASRTAGQGSAGIRASIVYSLLSRRVPRRRAMTCRMRSELTGVPGANVITARPSRASRRSTASGRATARSPATSRRASTAGGGGPKRSASSARSSSISAGPGASASRLYRASRWLTSGTYVSGSSASTSIEIAGSTEAAVGGSPVNSLTASLRSLV